MDVAVAYAGSPVGVLDTGVQRAYLKPTPEPATEIPAEEPTVQDLTSQNPEDLSRTQRQLDAQCAQMDIQEGWKKHREL